MTIIIAIITTIIIHYIDMDMFPPIKSLTCQNLHGWISQLYTLKARPLAP